MHEGRPWRRINNDIEVVWFGNFFRRTCTSRSIKSKGLCTGFSPCVRVPMLSISLSRVAKTPCSNSWVLGSSAIWWKMASIRTTALWTASHHWVLIVPGLIFVESFPSKRCHPSIRRPRLLVWRSFIFRSKSRFCRISARDDLIGDRKWARMECPPGLQALWKAIW